MARQDPAGGPEARQHRRRFVPDARSRLRMVRSRRPPSRMRRPTSISSSSGDTPDKRRNPNCRLPPVSVTRIWALPHAGIRSHIDPASCCWHSPTVRYAAPGWWSSASSPDDWGSSTGPCDARSAAISIRMRSTGRRRRTPARLHRRSGRTPRDCFICAGSRRCSQGRMVRDARRCRAPHHEGPAPHSGARAPEPHPEERVFARLEG